MHGAKSWRFLLYTLANVKKDAAAATAADDDADAEVSVKKEVHVVVPDYGAKKD